ncbi:uncharacterized protein LOC135206118 [Macrobrachium nipponense]|uniref:uncharacterized protein LOC135206118 n=1 Tax=Macrobrachium nipponense TaxID=159736 RepID=UPI0030C7ECFA
MSLCLGLSEMLDPLLGIADSHPRRWLLILAGLSVGWLLATCFIAVGMYMSSCISYYKVGSSKDGTMHERNSCGGAWTEGEAHAILVVGATINILILVLMVSFLIREKMEQSEREEPPPDYETLLKSETPPPAYNDLDFVEQPIYVMEANDVLSAIAEIRACSPEASGANPPSVEPSNQALAALSFPSSLLVPQVPSVKAGSHLSVFKTPVGNVHLFSPVSGVVNVV